MLKDVRLTSLSRAAGCAAKIAPGDLAKVLGTLPKFEDENLLVGVETSDDGAIYKINDEIAMVQTLDFFPPMVDDPFVFGQVAAANALSDIWAMGGEPRVALNIVAFSNCLDPAILGRILAGGADKVKEAGAVLAGGHSVQDEEPKYGLSVTGFVHPDKILKNHGCRPGDVLILTKQLGCGIVNTAVKAEMAAESALEEVQRVMTTLNKYAKEIMEKYDVSACTDVTGFGLMGHGTEMAQASGVTLEIRVKDVAFIKETLEYAKMGLVPAGAYRNREYAGSGVEEGNVPEYYLDALYDPQTSGGLLFSVASEELNALMADFEENYHATEVSVIGRVTEKNDKWIRLVYDE